MIKWVAIPVLLMASMLSRLTGSFELPVDMLICMAAIAFVQGAVRRRDYFWAAGFVPIVIVFSPLTLAVKIFLTMGLACTGILLTMLSVFRPQPVAVEF